MASLHALPGSSRWMPWRVAVVVVALLTLGAAPLRAQMTGWRHFPSDRDIAAARAEALGGATARGGRLLFVDGPTKYHDPIRLRNGEHPEGTSGVFLAYVVQTGGGILSVNGQAVGTSPTKVYGGFLQLYEESDGWYFGAMPRAAMQGGSTSALNLIGSAALQSTLRSEADVRRHIDRQFQPRPNGYGLVRGFPPGATSESEVPWEVVIGTGVAGVVVAGASLARRARRRKKPSSSDAKEPDPDPDEADDEQAVGFVLQVSARQLTVSMESPASLVATVWQVAPDGQTSIATDAIIHMTPTSSVPGMSVAPDTARTGQLTSTVSLRGLPGVDATTVTVHATVRGESHQTDVQVQFSAAWELVLS